MMDPLPYSSEHRNDLTRRELAALACRIIAVYLLTQALLTGGSGLLMTLGLIVLNREFDRQYLVSIAFTLVPALTYAAAGWWLWAKARWVASRMTHDDTTPVLFNQITAADLLSVALCVSGVFIAMQGVYGLSQYFARRAMGGPVAPPVGSHEWILAILADLVQLGVGLWLIFGSRGFANLVRRLRQTSYDGNKST